MTDEELDYMHMLPWEILSNPSDAVMIDRIKKASPCHYPENWLTFNKGTQSMTDEELIKELRNSKGWPALGNAAADRLEQLLDANWCLKAVIREQEYEIMEMKK